MQQQRGNQRHHTSPPVCHLLPLYTTTRANTWCPLANTLKVLTTCFSTAPTSILSTPRAVRYNPLWENMTSSEKPEVHNVIALSSEEDRATATGNMYRKYFATFGHVVFERIGQTDKQTHRQTDRHTRSSQYFALLHGAT